MVSEPVPSAASAPRVIAAGDGGFAAIAVGRRLALIDLETGAAAGDLALPHASADIAWLGTPPRLLILEPDTGFQVARLYDPELLEPCAEVRVEASMRVLASNGPHALLVGQRGAAIVQVRGAHIRQLQFATRTLPNAAGAAARQFVVAHPGAIDEWDPEQRTARRRMRLPRPAAVRALGGNERVVWAMTEDFPSRIEVIALVNRGQPAAHELPEPIARVLGHPRRNTVVAIGRDSGRIYVIDLDGRAPMRAIAGVERVTAAQLFASSAPALIVLRGEDYVVIGLDGRPLPAGPGAPARSPRAVPLRRALLESLAPSEPSPPPSDAPSRAPEATAHDEPPRPEAQELAGLAPRPATPRCSPDEYQALLEHYRHWVVATAVNAIARDWDSGRLVFPRQEAPPFQSEVLAIAGSRNGLATTLVAEAAAALDTAAEAFRTARAALEDRLTPLDVLRIDHQLTPTGELVLVFAAAPFMWGEIARLYGILANDQGRSVVDEHLLWQLLGDTVSRREQSRELDVGRPLLRHGLVRATGDRPRPFQALVADHRQAPFGRRSRRRHRTRNRARAGARTA